MLDKKEAACNAWVSNTKHAMSTDKEHLQWIYDHLIHTHGEPVNVDYMLRFQKIIDWSCDYIVPNVGEVTWKELPPKRLEQFSSATETLSQHLGELCDDSFKNGSIAAIDSLEVGLKKEWVIRLLFRIWPMIVLRRFREQIEEVLPLPAHRPQ